MNFILYIKCTEEQDFSYSNPFYELLEKEIPHADFLDLDNFSGQDLIDMAEKAIKSATKTCVLFNIRSTNSSKRFLKMATELADNPQSKMVFVNGKDEIISKILPVGERFCYHDLSLEEQVSLIRGFIDK